MSAFVPYQVDYSVENTAKSLGFSKKKIIFKFGIASNESIKQGMVGSNCRGSEHEITFIWSLKTGKRQILADNKEVHFSESGMNGWTADRTFQHHFGVVSPGFGTIRCHFVTLPSDPNAPGGNRPFDLRIGGTSYFDFCKIFQLGTPSMIVRSVPRETGGYGGGSRYPNPNDEAYATAEEREMIARAKLESLRDVRQSRSQEQAQNQYKQPPAPAPVPVSDNLISFDDPPPMPPRDISGISLDSSFSRSTSQISHGSQAPRQQAPAPYGNYNIPPAQPFAAPAYGNYQLPHAPVPAPAYSNYKLPPAQALAPAYSNYQLPPAPAPAPAYSNYQLPPAPAPAYINNQLPPAPAPAYSNYKLPPAPAPAPPAYGQPAAYGQPSAYGQNPAPAAGYGYGQPPPYQQQAPPSVDPGMAFAQPPKAGANPGFTSPQSAASYGSAPSFAQPPRQYGY